MLNCDTSDVVNDVVKRDTNPARKRRAGPARASVQARLSEVAVGDLFRPWEAARGILLAVSGGPDSIALLLLAAEWASGRASRLPLYAATVDHGLRADSRREAETVARWATELSLPHDILVWNGIKPISRIQERAREVRYRLLFHHAAKIGADHVMTAHHADDQAETILFRLLRGSGISGLSGMAASAERNGLILARPLLDYAKADLLAVCETKGHPFLVDPSNKDPGYARTRMRRLGGLLAREGFDRSALLRLGRRAARAEAALAARTQGIRTNLAARRERGSFAADISPLADEPEELLLRFLSDELNLIGNSKPVRLERLEALTAEFGEALRAGTPYAATLGGAALRLNGDRTLVIVKESARRRLANDHVSEGRS
jgi:tRNA(Ile)-lysidine synthase